MVNYNSINIGYNIKKEIISSSEKKKSKLLVIRYAKTMLIDSWRCIFKLEESYSNKISPAQISAPLFKSIKWKVLLKKNVKCKK